MDKQQLLKVIASGTQLAAQVIDSSLIEFTETSLERNLIESIALRNEFEIVSRGEMISNGWTLAAWSVETDTLVYFDAAGLLLCITQDQLNNNN